MSERPKAEVEPVDPPENQGGGGNELDLDGAEAERSTVDPPDNQGGGGNNN